MAKRMASSADERQTSSSTSDKRKKRNNFRISVRLGVACAGWRTHWALDRNGFVSIVHGSKRFVFARRLGDCGAHEINPDRQRSQTTGFILPQSLFLVKANPYPAGDTGREAYEPSVGVFVGGPGFAGQRMVELKRGAGRALAHDALEQQNHDARSARPGNVLAVRQIFLQHVALLV